MSNPPPPRRTHDGVSRTAEALFYEALELTPADRTAFLRVACGGDDSLHAEVEAYLLEYGKAGNFLEAHAVSIETTAEIVRVKPEEAGDRIGCYKLLEQIGEGGFGRVWVAEQEKPLRRRVALKIVKLGMDTKDVIARFEQERQALAMMEHQNIAKVLDAGATPTGRPFFVMELVRGVKITDYCDEAQLPTVERLKLFMQVCSAVQHAHQKGVIHRDLKPSNILVTLHDGVPVPKVIDFGVAKATQQQRFTDLTIYTQFQQMIGTPLYMAPEQAELSGLNVDTRSDIYSLGVLLYELLTGRTPFDPEKLLKAGYDEMRRVIREEEPQKPSTCVSTMAHDLRKNVARRRGSEEAKLIHSIRGDLDWIVMKSLEKDRNRRYDTATSLAHDIERHLANEPVQARPPTATYRLRRFAQRNRIAVGAGGAVALVIVCGLVLSTSSFVRERHQRKLADDAKSAADQQRQTARESERYARRLLYASDINLAQQAIGDGNLARARSLLDRHRPRVEKEDLRGWEWRFMWQQCRTRGGTILPRPTGDSFTTSFSGFGDVLGTPYALSFSRDGQLLAVGYLEGQIELWDVSTASRVKVLQGVIPSPTEPVPVPVGRVAFSPASNLLAATGERGQLKLWDTKTSEEITLGNDLGVVRDLAFPADGSRLAALCSEKGKAIVFDVNTREVVHTTELPTRSLNFHFGNLRLSPDRERLYVTIDAREPRIQCVDIVRERLIWEKPGRAAIGTAMRGDSLQWRSLQMGRSWRLQWVSKPARSSYGMRVLARSLAYWRDIPIG
jgi:serine/threonine protein kinase